MNEWSLIDLSLLISSSAQWQQRLPVWLVLAPAVLTNWHTAQIIALTTYLLTYLLLTTFGCTWWSNSRFISMTGKILPRSNAGYTDWCLKYMLKIIKSHSPKNKAIKLSTLEWIICNVKDPLREKKPQLNVIDTKTCLKVTMIWTKFRSSANILKIL